MKSEFNEVWFYALLIILALAVIGSIASLADYDESSGESSGIWMVMTSFEFDFDIPKRCKANTSGVKVKKINTRTTGTRRP